MLRCMGKVLLIFILFFSLSFGEDFERVCNKEVLKEDFNKQILINSCRKTAKNELKKKAFSNAAWYFLLIGENKKNINQIQPQIDDNIFVNVGHSYLLEGNIPQATQFYRKYIDKAVQPNNDIQTDFKILRKLYPNKKKLLNQGLQIWNTLYKPLLEIDSLYEKYDKEEKTEQYTQAINTLKKIIALRQNYSKKETDVISVDYSNLAILYGDRGEYLKALKFSKKSLEIDKEILGINHRQTGVAYSNLAYIYEKISNFEEAEKNNLLALNIFINLHGEKNHTVATTYNNLAYLYSSIGNYIESLKFYQKSLKIDREILDKNNSSISVTLNNIGELYSLLGNYPKSMKYYQEALEIDIKNHGKHHTVIAHNYNNIAQMYELLEDYQRAEKYYNKALKVAKNKLHKNHPFLATLYANLGNLYYVMGKDKKSFQQHKKAFDIRKELSKGKNSIDLALSYHAMGLLYQSSQDYNKSLEYFEKTLTINNKLLSKNNIANSVTYSSMGSVYQQLNKKKKALRFYLKALKLEKEFLGKNHRDLARSYNSLSLLYFSQKDNKMAYYYMKKAFQIFKHNRHQNFTLLDNNQRVNYSQKLNYYFNNILYLGSKNKDYQNFIFATNLWLNYKGTLFEYQNILSMVRNNPKTPKHIVASIDKLNHLNSQLSNIRDVQKEANLTKQIHTIEIELSRENDTLKNILNLSEINSTKIANYLQPHQLYIDFARGNDNYYIFSIDDQNNITFQQIDENRTKRIDTNIRAYRENTKNMAERIAEKKITEEYKEESTKEAKSILNRLYHEIMEEYLDDIIKDKTHLILSPDGLLNYLPFEALYNKNSYLIEKYTINYISSGKEFVRQTKLSKKHPKHEMILFANANFNTTLKASNPLEQTLAPLYAKTNTEKKIEKRFNNLGDIEIKVIKKHYSIPLIFQEENATIKNLMMVESSKILHLSTHGYISKNEKIVNPMRKAILVFAGANKNIKNASISALKLSALDLKDTELVILSACQSGLGDIQSAEGVVGLPKALLQAGAKNVLMSLWTVSNQKTATLMDYFYDNISEEQNYNQALQNAKIKMIKLHPYYWSSFILSGL